MSDILAITLIIILAAMSPGPDFAMVVKNTLLYSQKSGIFTALGVATSLLIHSTYCLLGLAIIISKSLLLFSIIKYIGASYLIFIGIKCLIAKKETSSLTEQPQQKIISNFISFRQGLLCNLLNPKAIMFILAFFTVILKPTTTLTAQLTFALEIVLIHFIWFSSLAIMLSHKVIKSGLGKIQFYFVKLMGVFLIGFGVRIATLHQIM